jgi:thymidylate kinase
MNSYFSEDYLKFLEEKIFEGKLDRLEALKLLHQKKEFLRTIDLSQQRGKPIVIEFSGTPRSGKTIPLTHLYEFFKKTGLQVTLLEEPAGKINSQIKQQEELVKMNLFEYNKLTFELARNALVKELNERSSDVILMDRGMYDSLIWLNLFFKKGLISEKEYKETINFRIKKAKGLVDFIFVCYANWLKAMQRDYFNSISIEPRRIINEENLTDYNNALEECETIFRDNIKRLVFFDTSNIDVIDYSMLVANILLDEILYESDRIEISPKVKTTIH